MWHLGRWSGKASWTGYGCRKLDREQLSRPGFPGLGGKQDLGVEGGQETPSPPGAACLHFVCSHCLFQTAGPAPSHTVVVNTLSVAWCSNAGTLLPLMALPQPWEKGLGTARDPKRPERLELSLPLCCRACPSLENFSPFRCFSHMMFSSPSPPPPVSSSKV